MEDKVMDLFPEIGIAEHDRLYILGNGFDVHHGIASQYKDFREWVRANKKHRDLIGLMDTFFSNKRSFWGYVEEAFGEYDEESITDWCEPDNDPAFRYEHSGQWQAGVEDSIPYIFGKAMDDFRKVFDEWVWSLELSGIETDLYLPKTAKYLTFNYTETLETAYGIPDANICHIHGSRLEEGGEFVIGHNVVRNENEPYADENILIPYQNAYSEVIAIMNRWSKDTANIIARHKPFFDSLADVKAVCVMGHTYNDIDMPYLMRVAKTVGEDCQWLLKYHTAEDKANAEKAAKALGLRTFSISYS